MTLTTRDIVMIALFAALTAALGLFPPITLPIAGGVPITAQSMGCMLAGALAGAKRGGLALALFALLVAIGLGGLTSAILYFFLCVFAQSQLMISDYVQHYGLQRQSHDGRPEPVSDRHSWNAPHRFTSHMMLNAPRHSAHHAHPDRRFVALTLPDPDRAPMLPYSLPAMSVIALAPPLWRRVMHPRLANWRA